MPDVYSVYEAKARFSEVMRKVRAGKRVIVAYRGEEIAEIAPLNRAAESLKRSFQRFETEGVLGPTRPRGQLKPVARRPGGLKRFLDSRE